MMLPKVKHRQVSRKRPGLDRSKTKPKLTFAQAPEGRLIPTNLSVRQTEAVLESQLPVNEPSEYSPSVAPVDEVIVEQCSSEQPLSEVLVAEEVAVESFNENLGSPVDEILPEDRLDFFQPLSAFFGKGAD